MPPEELYDVVADPHETVNLAGSPEHQAVLQELRQVLERWIEETNDQGRTLEPPEVAAAKGLTRPSATPSAPKAKKKSRTKAD
jgi:hypothetical protein